MRAGVYKGARVQYKRRLGRIKQAEKEAINKIGNLSNRDLLMVGLGLYWGEGMKKRRKVRINNSDPKLIKFIMKWFKEIWRIEAKRLTLRVSINKIHKNRVKEIEDYWSKVTTIPIAQFTKTTLINTKNKKSYKDFPKYYGTLTIEIRKPAELCYRILGLIKTLARNQERRNLVGE